MKLLLLTFGIVVFLLDSLFAQGKTTVQKEEWKIAANATIMGGERQFITFEGSVVAQRSNLKITCDKLIFYMGASNAVSKVVATGKVVQVERHSPEGKVQIGKALQAEMDVKEGTIVLNGGPPYLQDGDRYINTDTDDAKTILTQDGKYRVSSPGSRSGGVIVVPIDGAKKLHEEEIRVKELLRQAKHK